MKTLSRQRVKTKCTIQFEGAECGAASLCTILKFFGKYTSMEKLRKQTCVTRDGATAELIKNGAEKNNLNAKIFKANLMIAKEITNYPCIIYWKQSHFMVLEGFEKGYAYLSDPAHGRYRVPESLFKKCFSNIIIELTPNDNFIADGKEENNLMYAAEFLKNHKLEIIIYTLLTIFSLLPLLFIAGGVAYFIDHVLLGGSIDLALGTAWMIVLAAIISLLIQTISTLVLRRIEFKMIMKSGYELTRKLMSVPINFYGTRYSGELSQRAMFCFTISNMICTNLLKFSVQILNSTIIIAFVFISSPILAIVFMSVILLNSIVLKYMLQSRLDANVSYSMVRSQAKAITLQGISNIQVLKACGSEYDFLERWLNSYTESVDQTQKLAQMVAQSTVIAKFSVFFINVSIFTLGGLLVIRYHNISIGTLLAIQFLVSVITAPLADLAMFNNDLQVLDGALGRFNDLTSSSDDPYSVLNIKNVEQTSLLQVVNAPRLTSAQSTQGVIAEKISFKYAESLQYILEKINFSMLPRERVAFVGSSGCGKSTLVKVLAGLLEHTDGHLTINGKPWGQENLVELRNDISYVTQHPQLFNGSLRDNLTLFNSECYSDNDLHEAASVTGLQDLIEIFPNGLDYQFKDGASNISGGQKQLVEVTRALLRKPKWLLLDEATASLDVASEERLLNNLWNMDLGIISAAHRLKSAVMSNRVYVIKKGSIIEQGNPAQLVVDQKSEFSNLVKMETVN